MKNWDTLSVFFRDHIPCQYFFWTCEHFLHLICFLSSSESNDALLFQISLISFFHSPVITIIMKILVAQHGMAHGNAQLGFAFPVDAQEAGEHLVPLEIHLNHVLRLWGCWGSGGPSCSPEQIDELLNLCLQPQKLKS